MMKNVGLFILFSVLAALLLHEIHYLLSLVTLVHQAFYRVLGLLFANDRLGNWARQSLVLIIVPLVVAFIPSLIFRLIKKYWLPPHYFIPILWAAWVMLITLLAR